MVNFQTNKRIEKRSEARQPYSGHIFFSTQNGFYEGQLKNFSQHGLFIATKTPLSLGEIITAALPYLDITAGKCQGQIMWRNKEGFGVELFRRRNGTAQRYFHSDIKLRKQTARALMQLEG